MREPLPGETTPTTPVDTVDPWTPSPGSNTPPPDENYDESKRKPIWWYHTDHLGSSTYLTDNFGRPTHYYETLPFGEMMVEHNQSKYGNSKYDNAYKFNGKELDESTGMYYYGARYYDPRISIFVSSDPLVEKTRTPYQYVGNNPVNMIDPTGMNHHDYKLNSNGTFTKLQDTTTPDRVFNDKGEFVELETNGQIEKINNRGGVTFSKFTDKAKDKEAFEFFASNSEIEWGLLNTKSNSYVFNTGEHVAINGSGFAYSFFLSQNIEVTDLYHSHPVHIVGQESPSGYGHNPTKNNMYSEPNPYREEGDYQSLRLLIYGGEVNGVPVKAMGDKARNINFRVFNTVDKSYIQYDENKAIKLPK